MQINYGARAKIGVIDISSCANLEPELYALAPPGVAILTTRVPLPQTTPKELEVLGQTAEQAARELASAQPDCIVFACTSGSFINGAGYDLQIAAQLQAAAKGIPVVTTATALRLALSALDIKRFSLATPYLPIVTQRAVDYFNANGYQVVNRQCLGLDTDYAIGLQTLEQVERLACNVDCPQAEAVVISCTNLKTLPLLQPLEAKLGKPVISANQATLWHALRSIGIGDQRQDVGSLLAKA